MSRIFAITAASERVSVGGDGRGEITFTVTNSSMRPLRGQLRVRPIGSTNGEWLNIAGEAERAFSPNATQQVVVKVATPAGAPAGKYQFRLDAVSAINPDDDFTEGPTIDLEVKATEAPKKAFPWLLVAVAAGAAILVAAATWLLWPRGGTKVVFEDNFEEAPKSAWSQTKTETTPNGKSKFLGQFGTDSVKLALNDLPSHKTVMVKFDLYINNVWGGDDDDAGPDIWGLKLDGGETLINTTFSNVNGCSGGRPCPTVRQSYACKDGEDSSNGCYSRGADATFGAASVNSLGYNAIPEFKTKDSVYKIKHTFAHDKSQLILNFFSSLKERGPKDNVGNITGWGLDNVQIEIHSEELSELSLDGEDGTKVVFEDSFEEAPKAAWSTTKTETTPNGKTKFLGQFQSDKVKLTLNDLPPHKTVRVNFDLYIINAWEGIDNRDGNGPDNWSLYQGEEEPGKQPTNSSGPGPVTEGVFGKDSPILLSAFFSNLDGDRQTFACENGAYAAPFCYFAKTERATYGAAAVNSLGFNETGCYRCADSAYKIKRIFAHDKSQLILRFGGKLREKVGETPNKGWGLDNVRIEIQQ